MSITGKIKNLNFRNFIILSMVFISKPLYIIPTFKATEKTIAICTNSFGKNHHKDNKTNSFRHALWNFLICEMCFKLSNSTERTLGWAKKITDLHEKLSPNVELAKIMDLHNNKMGRKLFEDNVTGKIDVVPVLKEMMGEAVKVSSIEEIENVKYKLVYIEPLKPQV